MFLFITSDFKRRDGKSVSDPLMRHEARQIKSQMFMGKFKRKKFTDFSQVPFGRRETEMTLLSSLSSLMRHIVEVSFLAFLYFTTTASLGTSLQTRFLKFSRQHLVRSSVSHKLCDGSAAAIFRRNAKLNPDQPIWLLCSTSLRPLIPSSCSHCASSCPLSASACCCFQSL